LRTERPVVLEVTDAQLLAWLAAWLWPFLRIGAFVMVAPVVGTRSVPARVRMVFALGLTVVLAPLIEPATLPAVEILSAEGLVVACRQVIAGLAVGLVLRMVFLVLRQPGTGGVPVLRDPRHPHVLCLRCAPEARRTAARQFRAAAGRR
jgi:hypothetical protein